MYQDDTWGKNILHSSHYFNITDHHKHFMGGGVQSHTAHIQI